jgi:N-acyl homoserine lactone hydrolase
MGKWRIRPIIRGEIYGDRSITLLLEGLGERAWLPSLVWYLTDGQHRVLVDTSFGDPERTMELQPLFKVRAALSLEAVLRKAACPPEEIDLVIISHLHWDHCENLELFPNATLVVQREEMRQALEPLDIFAVAYNSPTIGRHPSWLGKHFSFAAGDEEILKGLHLVRTPGHTLGHQSVVVEATSKRYGIAADLFPLYENLHGSAHAAFHPPICVDYVQWWHSARKLVTQCEEILPGHDPNIKEEWLS